MKLLDLETKHKTITRVSKLLNRGNIVAIPTDTCFGLAANAKKEEAVKKVFKCKERPPEKPVSVFLGSLSDLSKVTSPTARTNLVRELLTISGRFTFLLNAKENSGSPSPYIIKENKIGVRIPEYKFPRAVAQELCAPITATSVNKTGEKPIYHYKRLKKLDLTYAVKAVLPETPPSTVIDLTTQPIRILREGAVSTEELEDTLTQLRS